MIRSLYTVNRTMNVLQKQQENTSGNLANSNTSGYKFRSIMQSTLQPHEMINHAGGKDKDKRQVLGEFIFGNQIDEKIINLATDGAPYETGNSTDFAIQGEGFFTIQLNDGSRGYTRNGNFRVERDGALVTQRGERVLSLNLEGGYVGATYTGVGDGFGVDYSGKFIDDPARLAISTFNNYDDLIELGNDVFTTNSGVTILEDRRVMQNYLESSNVDFTKEMVRLIEISREFESNQKMIQTADETLSKAVNEIGRL